MSAALSAAPAVALCACGQRARYHVFQATKPARAACVNCADSAPFYAVIRPIDKR